MKVRNNLSEIIGATKQVDAGGGRMIEVRGVSLEEISRLLAVHRSQFESLIIMAATEQPDWMGFVAGAPLFINDLLAVAMEIEDEEDKKLVGKLPLGTQVLAIKDIWGLTVPQGKKFSELVSTAIQWLQTQGAAIQSQATAGKFPAIPKVSLSDVKAKDLEQRRSEASKKP